MQFNIVYDDHFTSGSGITRNDILVPEGFEDLLKYSHKYLLDPVDLASLKSCVEEVLGVENINKIDKTTKSKR